MTFSSTQRLVFKPRTSTSKKELTLIWKSKKKRKEKNMPEDVLTKSLRLSAKLWNKCHRIKLHLSNLIENLGSMVLLIDLTSL